MKKKTNYLDKIPVYSFEISQAADEDGLVTLQVENKGVFNKIAQRIFKKPRISYIHLDNIGSFVWQLTDGKKSVYDIAMAVEEHFGEKAHPLYERLTEFFSVLENNGFIMWIK